MSEDNRPPPYHWEKQTLFHELEDTRSVNKMNSLMSEQYFNNFPPLQPREFDPSTQQEFLNRFQRRFPAFPLENLQDPYQLKSIPPTHRFIKPPEQELPALLYFLGYLGILVVIIIIFFITAAYLTR